MDPLVYLVPIALAVAMGYVVARVWRSWKDAGSHWGGGAPRSGLPPPADLDEDVRQAREIREDRERRSD